MRARRLAVSFAVAFFGALAANACGSSATGVDACKAIETARCQKLAGADCPSDPSFASQFGDVDSCTRFYDVQCGRGLVDGARAPSTPELNACVAAIKGDCGAAGNPLSAPACAVFLSPPPVTPIDAGDATPDETADTGVADTGAADTGAADDSSADAPTSD